MDGSLLGNAGTEVEAVESLQSTGEIADTSQVWKVIYYRPSIMGSWAYSRCEERTFYLAASA